MEVIVVEKFFPTENQNVWVHSAVLKHFSEATSPRRGLREVPSLGNTNKLSIVTEVDTGKSDYLIKALQ